MCRVQSQKKTFQYCNNTTEQSDKSIMAAMNAEKYLNIQMVDFKRNVYFYVLSEIVLECTPAFYSKFSFYL